MLFYNIIVQHICVCMLFYKSRAFFMSARAQLFTQQSEFCLLGFHLICNSASCDVTHIPTASDAAHTHICSSTFSVCVLLFFGGPLQLLCHTAQKLVDPTNIFARNFAFNNKTSSLREKSACFCTKFVLHHSMINIGRWLIP